MHQMMIATNEILQAPMPRILVVGSLTPPDASDWLKCKLKELSDGVFAALERAGAACLFVEASSPNGVPGELLSAADGLLVLGGGDADPACYGQAPVADTMYAINPAADHFELGLIRQGAIDDLPILGICRGMQLINIAFGGELIQEIGPGCHNGNADNSLMVSHPVLLATGSRLHSIYGTSTLTIRSAHHQAVAQLGNGLTVAATAEDQVIEAVEAIDKRWIVGVQWHPEDALAPAKDFDRLLDAFIGAAESGQARQLPV
ncbi:TPA: gamma-glutamyl-gamma-aminobutyrate hydrolase family protein [Klebsiella pneumoniae]|nr:gamma-glutamyl-gamma-aminobutyrate hydrolase family protein [Klebsiella pneumoniae]RZA65669.1 gamma-glutamyl-gamma-aminobutyrate hydrolase family protein [Klebsiella pneumoniae]HBY1570390.1 gamma-glutamyl-gamma-aminobutyrate hydrolase family protein [Klebsiella pneumoniae]